MPRMTFEMLFVFGVIVLAVGLFVTEALRVDLTAVLVMAILLASGVVSPEEGIAGFSNQATVTVAAMFVLSGALTRTGAVSAVGGLLSDLFGRSFWLGVVSMMVFAGVVSAFINNTAAVAILLPTVVEAARATDLPPTKLLIPLSFASIFGGVMTLIGTSTNILVSSIAADHGAAAFGMFEMTPLGAIFLVVGLAYMLSVGIPLLPSRGSEDLEKEYEMRDYLTEITVEPDSALIGKNLRDSPLHRDLDIDVLSVRRENDTFPVPGPDFTLEEDDVLQVRCDLEDLRRLQTRESVRVRLKPEKELTEAEPEDAEAEAVELVEAVVAPGSRLAGQSIESSRFRAELGATVLAVRHREQLLHEDLAATELAPGDALLLSVRRDRLENLRRSEAFVLVSEVAVPEIRPKKILVAMPVLVAVVLLAAFEILPIVVSAIAGCVVLMLTRVLTPEEAYQSIDWKVIFLLAGVLTLGSALETTGGAQFLADRLVGFANPWGPIAVVSAFYLLTSFLTEALSNNASAALLAPLAIATAESLGLDSRPFLMAVAFAASASFMTPVGYQTNTMVMSTGQYKFVDFFKVGAPLNFIYWMLATFLIPWIWPLQGPS